MLDKREQLHAVEVYKELTAHSVNNAIKMA